MTLVDTSVWIDFLLGRDLPHVQTLEALIRADEDLALCGLVLTEVLHADSDFDQIAKVYPLESSGSALP